MRGILSFVVDKLIWEEKGIVCLGFSLFCFFKGFIEFSMKLLVYCIWLVLWFEDGEEENKIYFYLVFDLLYIYYKYLFYFFNIFLFCLLFWW